MSRRRITSSSVRLLLLFSLSVLSLSFGHVEGKTIIDPDLNSIPQSPSSSSSSSSAFSFFASKSHSSIETILTRLLAEGASSTSLTSILAALGNNGDGDGGLLVNQVKSLIKKQVPSLKEVAGTLGVSPDYLQHFIKMARKVRRMGQDTPNSEKGAAQTVLEAVLDYLGDYEGQEQEEQEEGKEEVQEEAGTGDIQDQLLNLARGMFEQRFGNLSSLKASTNATQEASAGLWEVVKSTWARVLSYVEENNALESFMQQTPVKIIDRVMSLGDDLNLASFLAKKLDPEFAEFLAAKVEPLLGPLRDADTMANLTQALGLTGALDYFTSPRVKHTLYTLAGLVSAHLENRVNSDLARQFLAIIAQDNVELAHFYHALVGGGGDQREQVGDEGRARRSVVDHIVSTYEHTGQLSDEQLQETQMSPRSQDLTGLVSRDGGYGGGYGGGHGGGYGGGYGYGYMNTLDPYVVLGALALGTLLGFLLFRLLNGTGGGRRDIGDGSLSLWQSDMPYAHQSRGLRAERAAPTAEDDTVAPLVALQGDKWSSAPLVGNDTSTGLSLEEDDIADHLNQLWRAHSGNDSSTCVRNHLCGQLSGPIPEYAGLALILSSTANLLGVVGSGQLLDQVSGSQAQGMSFTCPATGCSVPL